MVAWLIVTLRRTLARLWFPGGFRQIVERQIQLQDVHTRLAKQAKLSRLDVLVHQQVHLLDGESTSAGDRENLKLRGGDRDVWIQTGSGSGDQVDRDVCRRLVQLTHFCCALSDASDQRCIGWSEV